MENPNCCPPKGENNQNCCTNENASSNKREKNPIKQKFGIPILGLAAVLAITTAFSSKETKEIPVSCETSVNLGDFELLESNKKVVYVLLEGTEKEKNAKLSEKITSVVDEINDTDGSAEFIKLKKGEHKHSTLARNNKIQKFPSILVAGKNCGSNVFDNSVKTISLVRAYDKAATLPSCSPAKKSSSCCSKK